MKFTHTARRFAAVSALLTLASVAHADPAAPALCHLAASARLGIRAAEMNLRNFDTADYRPRELVCEKFRCRVAIDESAFHFALNPTHPMADPEGWVEFGDVDVEAETQKVLDYSRLVERLEPLCRASNARRLAPTKDAQ